MSWVVIWLDGPLNQLARFVAAVWGTPAGEAITQAMARVDLHLERDAATAGESRGGHRRVIIELPITIEFEVHEDAHTAVVTRAVYTPGPRRPMSDEPALLAAILSHPDEDTPRLIYADWLQENGQGERAEFIRIQCAAELDEAAEDRAFELEERNRVKWLTGLPQFVAAARWGFRRGFPEFLDVAAEPFMDRFARFVVVPWLRSLCLQFFVGNVAIDFLNERWSRNWIELEVHSGTL